MRPLSLSVKKQWLMVKDSGRRSVGEVNRVHIPLLKIYFFTGSQKRRNFFWTGEKKETFWFSGYFLF